MNPMKLYCVYCEKPSGLEDSSTICFKCLAKHFPAELESIKRNCQHDYELSKREHQEDSHPVSMTSSVIRSVVTRTHFDTLICKLCGDVWVTDSACDCDGSIKPLPPPPVTTICNKGRYMALGDKLEFEPCKKRLGHYGFCGEA